MVEIVVTIMLTFVVIFFLVIYAIYNTYFRQQLPYDDMDRREKNEFLLNIREKQRLVNTLVSQFNLDFWNLKIKLNHYLIETEEKAFLKIIADFHSLADTPAKRKNSLNELKHLDNNLDKIKLTIEAFLAKKTKEVENIAHMTGYVKDTILSLDILKYKALDKIKQHGLHKGLFNEGLFSILKDAPKNDLHTYYRHALNFKSSIKKIDSL